MEENLKQIEELKKGLNAAFVDKTLDFNHAYLPQLLSNNPKENKKVLPVVEKELSSCEEFCISVAFITRGGITPLLQTLKELEKRGVKGKVLTTDYLHFSEPEAIKTLSNLNNIEIRMYRTDESNEGFHTKGYIFKEKGLYKIIVGSSNLTQSALTTSREWNSRFVSTSDGEYVETLLNEFEEFWNSEYTQSFDEFFDDYSSLYEKIKASRKEEQKIRKQAMEAAYEIHNIQPNSMQQSFLDNLKKLRDEGESKALLISATGTGKTYASAFAIRDMNPRKVLFLVHREQIAKKSLESYSKIFGDGIQYGLLSGSNKEKDATFLFATRDSMAKEDTLHSFRKDEFDVIVVDEVHRAGANTYQKIMQYFIPKFWLGMTATPERTDNFDIYKLFDHNIACEIRLQQALENDLLCPFHYFGITDITLNGQILGEDNLEEFRYLASEERVNHIVENMEYYGYSGPKPIGLIFVSRKEEGRELSKLLNERGYRTEFLSGEDSQEKREDGIDRLVNKDREDYLDYILSVDVFNEGIDIPEVNQVVMLRPTQSSIVFVQQLGRGLRKTDDKEYVVVLDFIGNHSNNYMIPIALSGDRSYNKDNMRRYVAEGSRIIPGSSTIHFDEISKKKIYESITDSKVTFKQKKDAYFELKNKLGRIPTMVDFIEYSEMDPLLFLDNKKRSYYEFVKAVDKEYAITFDTNKVAVLGFCSDYFLNGKRKADSLILESLVEKYKVSYEEIKQQLDSDYSEADYKSALNLLSLRFINTDADRKRYKAVDLIKEDNEVICSETFRSQLKDPFFYKALKEIIEFSEKKSNLLYKNPDHNNFCLYQKYSRKDVCRLLNWDKDESSTMYGYRVKYGTCPIFVTYEKKEDISSSTKYNDRFIDQTRFNWMTRSNVKLDSKETQEIINYKENGLEMFLFVKKSDDDGSEFYYAGKVIPYAWEQTEIENDKGKMLPIMNIKYNLEHSVRDDIYDYFTSGEDYDEDY